MTVDILCRCANGTGISLGFGLSRISVIKSVVLYLKTFNYSEF